MNHKVPGDGVNLPYRISIKNNPLPGEKTSDNAGVNSVHLKWCTLECEHAASPRENIDGAGSCRTFSAIWCKAMRAHATRNAPCAVLYGQRRPKPNW